MRENQLELLNKMRLLLEEVSQIDIEYWQSFSSFGTWQFWVIILGLVIPLVALLVLIDKRNILLLGFYGFNIHVWIGYADLVGIRLGLWQYPYAPAPVLPSFALDASLIPVTFMLVYQWTLNQKKNFYLYSLLLSAVYAFMFKPLMSYFHFFKMFQGVNYIHLFFIYTAVFIFSKLVTNIFLRLQSKHVREGRH